MTTDDDTIDRNNRDNETLTPKAALARIKLILETPASLDDERGFQRSVNLELDEAQGLIRDYLDRPGDPGYRDACEAYEHGSYRHISDELMRYIFRDLGLIWGNEFMRDEISTIAMNLSLCPMHFCDWAACFDDAPDDCAAIRAIFPYSHDT